jgi:dipeptidyl aminopeptidase/acylaminoacyl peptidase
MQQLEPGVFFQERVLGGPENLRVWLYAPDQKVESPVGCVVVPPAGGTLITGMRLGEGDRPEHLPFVRAGYVVVSFDIAGARAEPATEEQAFGSLRAFRESEAGVANAIAALDVGLETYPTIDLDRVYASGHSSAGTLALLFAARDARIKAVAAFAPVIDALAWHSAIRAALSEVFSGYDEFLTSSSPMTHATELAMKPVFLFHARDDSVVPPAESELMMTLMPNRHAASQRVVVDEGDHYDSMIREGLPKAIAWFGTLNAAR